MNKNKHGLAAENAEKKSYRYGQFETVKFIARREDYYQGLEQILQMGYSPADLLHQFPAFVGHMTLWRFLSLYEFYKKTQGICGHIADIGVDMGASSLLFTKLVQIFEPEALTLVHGFDWFQGYKGSKEDKLLKEQSASGDEARVRELVRLQKFDHILKIHKLDLAQDGEAFFEQHPQMRFKLVYVDCGNYAATCGAINAFWPRLVPGGIMLFDQFNNEVAPGETRAVSELLPELKIETIPNAWMPNAFIQKPFAR